MVVKQKRVYAHSTVLAVAEILPTANSTKAALVTMVWLILGRHPQIADTTMIVSKLHTAVNATIPVGHLAR